MTLSIILTHHDQPDTVLKTIGRFQSEDVPGAELIVVDDDSRFDAAASVCAAIAADPNTACTFVSMESWGCAGGARNRGVREARGKYLWFVDGDDEIYRGSVRRMVEFLDKCEAEIVMLPYTEGHGADLRVHALEDGEAPPKPYQWRIAPWGKVILRDIFTPFAEKCFYEDTDWHFRQCDRANTRDFLPGSPVYFYDRTPDGGSQMTGIVLLEQHGFLNVDEKLALDDGVLNRAIAERLRMVARLIDDYRNRVLVKTEIRNYVRRFSDWMLTSITKG